MTTYHHTSDIDYESTLAPDSPFPEWIETDRLRFERLSPDTVPPEELLTAFKENEGTDRYFTTDSRFEATYEGVYEYYDVADRLWENHTDAFYATFNRDSSEFVGITTLEDVDFGMQYAELGFWVLKDHWGNGYAQEEAEAMMEVLFNHLDIRAVGVRVVPENTKSVKAVLKFMNTLGGRFDGRIRHATYTPTGDIYDIYKWSVLNEEYNDPNSTYVAEGPDHPDV